jgi:hypothetical protein
VSCPTRLATDEVQNNKSRICPHRHQNDGVKKKRKCPQRPVLRCPKTNLYIYYGMWLESKTLCGSSCNIETTILTPRSEAPETQGATAKDVQPGKIVRNRKEFGGSHVRVATGTVRERALRTTRQAIQGVVWTLATTKLGQTCSIRSSHLQLPLVHAGRVGRVCASCETQGYHVKQGNPKGLQNTLCRSVTCGSLENA